MDLEDWDIHKRRSCPPPIGQVLLRDVLNWSWYEYGMRVGLWRFHKLSARLGIWPTLYRMMFVNGAEVLDWFKAEAPTP